MKIAAVFGSPRKKGNSETLAEAFLQEAERLGAEVERFHLNQMTYRGCIACYSCKKKGEQCALNDDLSPVLDAVYKAETVLLATPVYFFDMPSQLKAFVDRWYSFFKPHFHETNDISRLPSGKNAVFVVTQKAPDSIFVDFVQRYDFMFKIFGFRPMHLIRGCDLGDSRSTASRREELLEKARETARRVMAGKPSDAGISPYPHPRNT
jgi:putative NADPH-quinone reductase